MRGKSLTCREGVFRYGGLRPRVGDPKKEGVRVPASQRLAAHRSGKAIRLVNIKILEENETPVAGLREGAMLRINNGRATSTWKMSEAPPACG